MARSKTLIPLSRRAVLVFGLLALLMTRTTLAQSGRTSDSEGDAFTLVAQALRAKLHLVYLARQDILWTSPTPDAGATQIIVDIAHAGRRADMTYRFPPEAAGRVMTDDGTHASLYDPRHRTLLVGQSLSNDQTAVAPVTLALLHRNYCCLRLRREVLNGQVCDVIAIRPRSEDGPSKSCWIALNNHALLRTEEYDAQGCRRYISFYESVRFLSRLPPGSLSLPQASCKASTRHVAVQMMSAGDASQAFASAGIAGRLPAWCPHGYILLHCAVVSPRPGLKAVLLHYCDGLKTLTILEESRAGPQPAPAELNRALAQYGQQAWVRDDGPVRTVIRGDLSVSPALGAEMIQALSPSVARSLAQGLAHDFGAADARRGAWLRRRGWGYEQIGALCLWQHNHPHLLSRLKSLLGRSLTWPQVAAGVGADADLWEDQARAWVAATLIARP